MLSRNTFFYRHVPVMWCLILAGMIAIFYPSAGRTADLRLISWNVEGGAFEDSELETILDRIKGLGPADLWALSEVTATWTPELRAAVGLNYRAELGTQATDRLLVLINLDRFSVVEVEEIRSHKPSRNQRPPLAVTVRERSTETELIFVASHLIRGKGDDPKRLEEAKALRHWGERQNVPIILTGDFNFDWSIQDNGYTRSVAFDELLQNDVFEWSVPPVLRRTQCNRNYNSILDFVFVAGKARSWLHRTTIVSTKCIDTEKTSDHRPIETIITLPD